MVSFFKENTLTDDQIQKGTPVRAAFRKQVLTDLESFNDLSMEVYRKMDSLSAANAYKKYVKEELAWINANPELSVRQVETRKKQYTETSEAKVIDLIKASQIGMTSLPLDQQKSLAQQFPIVAFRKNLIDQVNSHADQVKQKEQEEKDIKRKEIENKTTTDITLDAVSYAFKWAAILLLLAVALRIASFAANDSLHLAPSFRILNFAYGFLFSPLLLPYYIYREVWGWWTNNDTLRPHFESLIPLVPYEPKESLTLSDRIYGYANTAKLCEWVRCKQSIDTCKKESALKEV